nr:putative RNA-directed DNA polymerase [Ipomoea batatas]
MHYTPTASNAWKGICKAKNIIKEGLRKRVRNGRNTSFWTEPWITGENLAWYANVEVPEEEHDAMVADYWDEERGWNDYLFQGILPDEITDKLKACMLSNDNDAQDELFWEHEANGNFSVTSAYGLIQGDIESLNDKGWERLWQVKVPNKICTFLWLVRHGRIMTNHERKRRGFIYYDQCQHCLTIMEDINHLLRHCPKAMEVWRKLLPQTAINKFWNIDFLTWFDLNVAGKGAFSSVENGPILFAITLWWIWRWRNEIIFKGKSMDIDHKIRWINMQVAESVRAFEKISQPASNTHNKVQRLIRWTKPPDGWTKMNIDGSRDTLTGHASCGGLLRDVNGNWLLGFKAKVGHCSIEEAEAWSILKGLKTIWNHGYRKVIIESDAKRVVDWINASEYEKSPTGMVANIINECRKWLRMNWQIQLNYVFREQNKVADALARMALKSTNDWMFLPQPESELLGLLNDDILGIPVSRLVCTES